MENKHLLFTVLSFVAVNTLKSAQGVVRNTTSGCEVTVDLTDGQTPAVKHTTLGGSPQIALVLNVDGVNNTEEIILTSEEIPWINKGCNGCTKYVRFRSVILSSQEDVSWSINTTDRVSECRRNEVNIKTCTVPLVTTLGNSRLYFYVCLGLLTVSIIINIVLLVCVLPTASDSPTRTEQRGLGSHPGQSRC